MPKHRAYDSALIDKALQELQEKGASVRSIAGKYGIPKSTIHFKLKHPNHKETFGPPPILTSKEEQCLVRWISELGRKGFPRKLEDLVSSVQKFLDANPRPNPFKNNRPGNGWIKAFLRRNPQVRHRQSEAVSAASACVTEADIRKWFSEVGAYFKEKDLSEVLKNPSRVFNGDETGFQICPATGRVLAEKGTKNVYTIEKGASKENVTVMFTFSASGEICAPMIVYPYKRIPEKIIQSVPPQWGIARSDNGWMTAETFYEYIANVLHPYLVKQKTIFPIILFVDGHKSHITYNLSILCNTLQIELIALYPNATRILQPADVAVFSPVKAAWRKIVRQFYLDNPGETINKGNIAPLLQKIVVSIKSDTLINGFRICGLCPFDANKVDYTKCLGSTNANMISNDKQNNANSNTRTMSYDAFANIVGPTLIKKFEEIDEINSDENFKKLFLIWGHYQEMVPINLVESSLEEHSASSHMNNTPSLMDNQIDIGRMEGSIPISSCSTIIKEPENAVNSEPPSYNKMSTSELTCITAEQVAGSSSSSFKQSNVNNTHVNNSTYSFIDKEIDIGRADASTPPPSCNTIEEPKNDIFSVDTSEPPSFCKIYNSLPSSSTSEQLAGNSSNSLKQCPIIPSLSPFIMWPNSPKRKNKRQIERTPYAVTSEKYRKIFEAKRILQFEKEKEKEEKKEKA